MPIARDFLKEKCMQVDKDQFYLIWKLMNLYGNNLIEEIRSQKSVNVNS